MATAGARRAAASDRKLTSFEFIDALLKSLADKRLFPNLTAVVVAGHSAGGQFVARYQMANRVHDTLESRCAMWWPTPPPTPGRTPAGPCPSPTPTRSRRPRAGCRKSRTTTSATARSTPPSQGLRPLALWPGEPQGRLYGGTSDEQLKAQLISRPVTYLLSQVDVVPLGGFDDSANAMAQGPTRRAPARLSSITSTPISAPTRARSSCPSAATTTAASTPPTRCCR